MEFTRANNWRFITSVKPETWPKPFTSPNWRLPLWGDGAPIRATLFSPRDLRAWSTNSFAGSRGWRKERRRLLRNGPNVRRRLRRQRPLQFSGESVKGFARRAFHGHAFGPQAIEEHTAIRRIKRKKVRPAEEICALRIFLLERFRILSKEPHRMLFAIQLQAGHQNNLLFLFLLENRVTVAAPRCWQHPGPVLVAELLPDFLPAIFTQDVFVEP